MDLLVLVLSFIIGWSILRSRGGHGLGIKFKTLPLSTPEGKKNYIAAWAAFGIMAFGVIFFAIQHQRFSYTTAVALLAVTAALAVSIKKSREG